MKKILKLWIAAIAVLLIGSGFLTSCSEGLVDINSTNTVTNTVITTAVITNTTVTTNSITNVLISTNSVTNLYVLSFNPADTNRLLLIDEANETLVSVNPATGAKDKTIGVMGTAANDIESDGTYAYMAVSLDNLVLRIKLSTGDGSTLSFPGANPYQLHLSGNRLYASLSVSNQLAVINTSDFSLVTNVSLPSPGYPQKIVSDSSYLYVTSSGGYVGWNNTNNYKNSRIIVLDKSTFAVVTNIPVSLNPVGLAISGTRLFVACAGNYDNTAGIDSIDLSNSYAITTLPPYTNTIATAMEVNGNSLYTIISQPWPNPGYLSVYNISSNSVITNLLSATLKEIVFDGSTAYVSEAYGGTNTYKIDTNWNTTTFSPTGGGDLIFY